MYINRFNVLGSFINGLHEMGIDTTEVEAIAAQKFDPNAKYIAKCEQDLIWANEQVNSALEEGCQAITSYAMSLVDAAQG